MIDIKLDKVSHDIDLSANDLTLINGIDRLEQKIKVELLFFFAEWFLDTTLGIKYFESVFIKNPNLTLIDSLFKTAILDINEINELLSYNSEYNSSERKFSMTFSVNSTVGETTLSLEVP